MPQDRLGLVGKRFREYEILEIVGRGGMGSVYRARHVLLQEDRAIKVVVRNPAEDHEFIERFIREARVLARLKDQHLVRLYEFWEDAGQLFMALEFLSGVSVAQRLRERTRLSVAEAVDVARQAAQGLKVAHEGNVIHRDISPDNLQLVVGEDGQESVKVIDFGIAKALEESARELTANLFLGKFEYASPEQCGYGLEKGERIDSRSDIYSLGVTLYKMVTGGLPFDAATPQGYLVKHATEAPAPPSSRAPQAGIPDELDRIVLRALAKKRSDRQQSMGELIRELNGVQQGKRRKAAPSTIRLAPTVEGTPPSAAVTGARSATGKLRIGESFARKYVIRGVLGEGGMGIVYRAVDNILDEPVALKVISSRILGGSDAVERLKREVVLARRVSHPNVCRIYDIGESEEGTHYVSMQYIDGQPLSRVLSDRGTLALREGVPLVRQVLDALEAAHRVNVIHRDLKPDNVMVTPEGHALIMDFGLSLSEDSRRVTQAGSVVGTPHYMAPEQVSGAAIDPRSDFYAVGVILFRMFTGRLPFVSENMLDVLKAHLATPPPRPRDLKPDIPRELEDVILKALEKDPAERFASAAEFLAALDPIEPAQVRTSTESGRVVRVPSTVRAGADPGAAPTEAAPVEGSLDPDLETVRDFMAGMPTAVGSATAEPEAPPLRPPTAPRVSARGVEATAREATSPPARRPGVTAVGGAAAALAVGAGAVWYWIQGPGAVPSPQPTSISEAGSVTLAPAPPRPVGAPSILPSPRSSTSTGVTPSAPTTIQQKPDSIRSPRTEKSASPAPPPSPSTAPPTPTATAPPPTPAPAPTEAPTPGPERPSPAPTVLPSLRPSLTPEQGVRQALARYAEAFSNLDRQAVREIFPTVPDRNFQGLDQFKAYRMEIQVTEVKVDLPRVLVEARIRNSYTAFSGKQDSRTVKEKMVFIESGGAWVRVQ